MGISGDLCAESWRRARAKVGNAIAYPTNPLRFNDSDVWLTDP
jgi:hypothetical protein